MDATPIDRDGDLAGGPPERAAGELLRPWVTPKVTPARIEEKTAGGAKVPSSSEVSIFGPS